MSDETMFVWEMPEFQRLLAAQQPGRAFALIRRAHGLSQADFGVLLHWDRSHAGRVEREEVATLFDVRELTRVADLLGVPRRALLPVLLGAEDIGTISSTEGEGEDTVDRRQFGLTMFGTAIAAAALPGVASASASITVGDDHIGYLNGVAEQLWSHDAQFGSGGLVESAVKQFATARQLLDHGVYDRATGAELAAVAGNLANCAGWLAFDSGDQAKARTCVTEALVLAERSGDRYLWSDVMDNLRHQSWRAGDMREGLQISQRISEAIRHVPSARLQSLNAARLAVAYAAVGDRRAAEAAIAHAWREVDRGLDDPNDPSFLHFITAAEIQSITAHAWDFMGRHDQAVAIYQESLGAHNKPRDEASYRAYCSASLARLGDHSTAITEGLSALTLLHGPVKSPRLVSELQPVRAAADALRSDEAEQFSRQYDRLLVKA